MFYDNFHICTNKNIDSPEIESDYIITKALLQDDYDKNKEERAF